MARGRTTRYTFDPFEETGAELPEDSTRAEKQNVLSEAADFLRERVIEYMDDQNSPVAGHGAFKSLTKAYAKRKKAGGGSTVPDLEFSGDMKHAIKVFPRGDRIVIEVTGKQGAKADGHCNLSGDSELPLRRFIPDEDESFKRPILEGIARIIKAGG